MTLPKKLNICGKIYKVTYTNSFLTVDKDGSSALWGQCIPAEREIRIYKGRDKADILDALIHEMIHALLHDNQMVKTMLGDDEESFVTDIASAITDCLIRNKLAVGS